MGEIKPRPFRIVLYTDNTLPLAVDSLCKLLNSICKKTEFSSGREPFRIDSPQISYPASYRRLTKKLIEEARDYDLAILCTNVPYDNNYFFQYYGKIGLISFSGWHLLTNLPVTNGLIYFVASGLCDQFEVGAPHYERNTGCINDFLVDKRGIDFGMRAASICGRCLGSMKENENIQDIQHLLNLLSNASRSEKDVLEVLELPTVSAGKGRHKFNVFIAYNSQDEEAVRNLNDSLKSHGVKTWFDKEQAQPGFSWIQQLEKQVPNIGCAAVCVGQNGIGPWQNLEINAFLTEFVKRGCPVIPVILPGTEKAPNLPVLLRDKAWVDLRINYERELERLISVCLQE